MASSYYNPSYQKLKKLSPESEEDAVEAEFKGVVVLKGRSGWFRLKRNGRWRRPRVRVAGLRRFFRRKARVVGNSVRASIAKVLKRLKEGRPYLGELFAGNYMFMQVSPSPTISYVDKSLHLGAHHYHQHGLFPPPTLRVQEVAIATGSGCTRHNSLHCEPSCVYVNVGFTGS
ncbi:unnamed protein product [Musa textilis]